MNSLGEDLFPGAALTIDQHADVGLRHHPRLLQQTQHQRATGHNRFTPAIIRGGRRLLKRLVDRLIQRIFIHGFSQEAEHAFLRCRDRIRNRTVGGQNDDRHSRLHLLDLTEQLHAVHLIHPQIAYHQIHFFTVQNAQPFSPALCGHHAIAFTGQTHAQQF